MHLRYIMLYQSLFFYQLFDLLHQCYSDKIVLFCNACVDGSSAMNSNALSYVTLVCLIVYSRMLGIGMLCIVETVCHHIQKDALGPILARRKCAFCAKNYC